METDVVIPKKYPMGLDGIRRQYHDRHVIDIDYDSAPAELLGALLRRYKNVVLCLDDVLLSNETFTKVYQDLLDILKWAFAYDDVRNMPIHFTIHHDSKTMNKIELKKFLSNMILWFGFLDADAVDEMDEDDIFPFDESESMKDIITYLNDHIIDLFGDDNRSRNACISEISFHMSSISRAFGPIMSLSFSTYNIIQSEKENPEIHDLMYYKIPDGITPHELEQILSENTDKLINAICKTKSQLRPLFLSGKNLNKNQVKEIFLKIGFKADTNGNTIPYVVDCNLLINGISKPSYIYIQAISGRKSLILTKVAMSEPGTFSKRLTNNTTSAAILDQNPPTPDYRCDSEVPITYHIMNSTWLKCLHGRYYFDPDTNELKILNYRNDSHLIDRDVKFLSPVTCTDPRGVCPTCYGRLYKINKDLTSAGAFAATKLSEPIGQMVLSSKHSQTTNSVPIVFRNEFGEVFELNSAEISLREDTGNDEEDDIEWSILLGEVFIEESEDVDVYYVNQFSIIRHDTGESIHIEEENGSRMYLSDEMVSFYKSLKAKNKPIPIADLENQVAVLFNVEIKNGELTEPLRIIKGILNTKDHAGAKTIDELCQKTAEFYLDIAKIPYDLVHCEMVIRGLIRKLSNSLERPDFGPGGDHNDYQLMTINGALFENPSATTAMTYPYLKRQLASAEFWKKSAPGHSDAMFVPRLSDIIWDEDEIED